MKKWGMMLLSAFWLVGLLGCSGAAGNGSAGEVAPVELNLMTFSFAGGGWPEDHPVVKALNEKLSMNLTIEWTSLDIYAQKLNVMAASNEFPDVFLVEEPEFNKWKDKGVFMDISAELGKYPNLTRYLSPEGVRSMNPKGKVYGLPYYITETRDSLIIRKDWLDKLGLRSPATVDDFLEVAQAFALRDPDGNGKADTSGFSISIVNDKFYNADSLMGAFGLGNEWTLRDGKLTPMQIQTKELKRFLTFIRQAYESGALDRDFPTNKLKDPLSKLEDGKTGIATVVPNEFYSVTLPAVKKRDPHAELVQLIPPKGTAGLQATHTMATTIKIVINAKIDPLKQQKALEFLDYLLSDEGYDLIKHGVEGVHYQKNETGTFEKLEAFDKDRPQLLSIWFFRRYDPDVQIRKWDDPVYASHVRNFYETNARYRWSNPAAGLNSETMAKLGGRLQHQWMSIITKVAIGQLPLSAVDEAAASWIREGGDKIIQEINDEYRKTKQ